MAKTSLIIPGIGMFNDRQGSTQWPTFRGARLDEDRLRRLEGISSLVFAKGTYRTNLNAYWKLPPMEEFCMWESEARVVVPKENLAVKGNGQPTTRLRTLYLLCWVGNYAHGSIFHCGWQFPHVLAHDAKSACDVAFGIYRRVALIMYGGYAGFDDGEVRDFIKGAHAAS